MFDEGIVEELVDDINSWSNFYIVSDEESVDSVRNLQKRLDELNISSFIVHEVSEYEFEQDDCLLAVSGSGEDKDECIFAEEANFYEDFQEFLNAIVEKVESQLKKEEFEINHAFYLGPGETTFIVSDSQSMILAEELERNLTSKGFKVTIISKGMEDEFKSNLQKGNSVIAITRIDDFFVLGMVEFAKSKGIFVLGMGCSFKSILAQLSDEFRSLTQVDELAGILYEMEDGFKQTKIERAMIKGPPTNNSKRWLVIAILIFVIILIIWFVLK